MPPLATSIYDRLILHGLKRTTADELQTLKPILRDAPAEFVPLLQRSVDVMTELLDETNRYLYGDGPVHTARNGIFRASDPPDAP